MRKMLSFCSFIANIFVIFNLCRFLKYYINDRVYSVVAFYRNKTKKLTILSYGTVDMIKCSI